MAKTDVYVHGSKDEMWEKGEELGLTGDALRMFSYTATEVKLTIDVDEKTGESTIIAVDDKPLK